MANEPTLPKAPDLSDLKKFTLPKGWNALYEPSTKKVFVLKEFPVGGTANSKLTLINKPTEAELMAEVARLGLSWTPITVIPPTP